MFRISLVIATYNRAAPLVAALESVARQDLPAAEWECVVVNNRSTDDTAERFAAFAAAHPECHLRMVDEPQQGLSHARNRGIAEAEAPLLAFIDDDERIEPQFLRAYVALFDGDPTVQAAGGRIVAEYPDGRPAWLSKYTEIPIANTMDFGPKVRPFPAGRIPGGGNMALRRAVFEKCGAFDPQFGRNGKTLAGGEETDLFERIRARGHTLWYAPAAVMHHIIPAAKLTETYFRTLCRNIGIGQRMRALNGNRLGRARAAEVLKWGATLLLCCTMRPVQARWLLRMRREITRGLFSATEK
ncbi:MAG: glycosyltransferase [Alistipes senegalensis]|nr:glycosyltransferase [Bacteroides cellulosilyticus]MCM1351372.1 glycosyltransferase [Alistipes senegalensis]